MDWISSIGSLVAGLPRLQQYALVVTAIGASIGLIVALITGSLKVRAAVIEARLALRVKKLHERNIFAGTAPDFTRDEITKAIREYIIPDCSQTDPSNSADLRKVAAVRQSVIEAVNNFISNSDNKHLLILADTGMGKTTFCLNFQEQVLKASMKSDGPSCSVISLGRTGALDKIKLVPAKNDTILILDAFDEDVEAQDNSATQLSILMNEAASFKAVIVTCRSQFFIDDNSIPHRTGVRIVRPRSGGGEHVFETLYLLPFNDRQIKEYVTKQFPAHRIDSASKKKKAFSIIGDIPELSVRPMLLALLPELIKNGHNVSQLYDLYKIMISNWLDRESSWIEPQYLIQVSKALAVYMYAGRQKRSGERVTLTELHAIGKAAGVPENVWTHLSARSLLNRDSEGGLKFSHRSIMEYFFVRAAIDGEAACFDVYWTDFMRDLFVSWGNTTDGTESVDRAKEILGLDLEKVGLSPLSQQLALADNYSPRSYLQRRQKQGRRIAKAWRNYSSKLSDTTGQRVLQDHEYGLMWLVPPEADYGDPTVRAMTHIQVMKPPYCHGLASRDQFLSLLEAESTTGIDLVPRGTYLWLSDTVGGQPVVVTVSAQSFEKPGARLIGSFDVRDRNGLSVWAYVVATRPAGFGARVPIFKAIPTMVSEMDWEKARELANMSEAEVLQYIEWTFSSDDLAARAAAKH